MSDVDVLTRCCCCCCCCYFNESSRAQVSISRSSLILHTELRNSGFVQEIGYFLWRKRKLEKPDPSSNGLQEQTLVLLSLFRNLTTTWTSVIETSDRWCMICYRSLWKENRWFRFSTGVSNLLFQAIREQAVTEQWIIQQLLFTWNETKVQNQKDAGTEIKEWQWQSRSYRPTSF